MKDLTSLRKIAEAATPGEWWTKQFEPNVCDIFAGDGAGDNPGVAEAWHPEDATHIATFDPPTVLALLNRIADLEAKLSRAKNVAGVMASRNVELTACNREAQDRLEQAERDLVVVRESQKKIAKQFAAMGTEKGKAEWRAREAEAAVARVRELALESQAEVAQMNMPNIRTLSGEILRALDGEQA